MQHMVPLAVLTVLPPTAVPLPCVLLHSSSSGLQLPHVRKTIRRRPKGKSCFCERGPRMGIQQLGADPHQRLWAWMVAQWERPLPCLQRTPCSISRIDTTRQKKTCARSPRALWPARAEHPGLNGSCSGSTEDGFLSGLLSPSLGSAFLKNCQPFQINSSQSIVMTLSTTL